MHMSVLQSSQQIDSMTEIHKKKLINQFHTVNIYVHVIKINKNISILNLKHFDKVIIQYQHLINRKTLQHNFDKSVDWNVY